VGLHRERRGSPAQALTVECDHLRTAKEGLEAERDRLVAETEGAAAARARLEQALEHGQEEARTRERATSERLENTLRALEALRAERAEEAGAAAVRVDALAAECEELRAAVATLGGERDRLAAEVQGAAAARVSLEEALQRALEEMGRREPRVVEDTGEASPAPAELEAEASIAPLEEPGSPSELGPLAAAGAAVCPDDVATDSVSQGPSKASTVVVIDSDRTWATIAVNGHGVVAVPPSADLATSFGDAPPARVLVNLASPHVLEAVAAWRDAGFTGRVWGCLADAASGRAFPLGAIELGIRPLDPDVVLASLARHASRGARVMTVGDDVDAFVSLRQALARQGMSVSMAWNTRQAADLLPVVRPEVLVLDLDLFERDGRVLRGSPPATRPRPRAHRRQQQSTPAFAAVLTDPARQPRDLTHSSAAWRRPCSVRAIA
jgi:hypothetical protein